MFVNTATSKATPATRRNSRACDDTSSTAAVQPRSTASRSSRCNAGASGVVCGAGNTTSPNRYSTVPKRAGVWPAARSADSTK